MWPAVEIPQLDGRIYAEQHVGGTPMGTAAITLRAAEFVQTMSEMRAWLDQQHFEPLTFTYNQDREIIVISVDFREDHHAEAFQSRFGGRDQNRSRQFRLGVGQGDYGDRR